MGVTKGNEGSVPDVSKQGGRMAKKTAKKRARKEKVRVTKENDNSNVFRLDLWETARKGWTDWYGQDMPKLHEFGDTYLRLGQVWT